MSKITNVEIVKSKLELFGLTLNLSNGLKVILLNSRNNTQAIDVVELASKDLERLIEYRNKHRTRVRNYYDKNLRKKVKK